MKEAIGTMPAELFKTLNSDRGKEMARHKEIKVATGVQVYLCDPHAPGSADPTKKPIGCSASFFPVGLTSPNTAERISLRSPD